jgi:hypothetical protein
MSKKIATKIGCSSFNQHDLHLLGDYKFLFFSFCVCSFKFLGVWGTPLERSWNYLSNNILHTPRFLKFQSLNQNQQHTNIKCNKVKNGTSVNLKVAQGVTLWRAYATFYKAWTWSTFWAPHDTMICGQYIRAIWFMATYLTLCQWYFGL